MDSVERRVVRSFALLFLARVDHANQIPAVPENAKKDKRGYGGCEEVEVGDERVVMVEVFCVRFCL